MMVTYYKTVINRSFVSPSDNIVCVTDKHKFDDMLNDCFTILFRVNPYSGTNDIISF